MSYQVICYRTLKTGEAIEIGIVHTPNPEHSQEIQTYFSYRKERDKYHIRKSLTEVLDTQETRYYVAKLNGKIVANVTTIENQGIGIVAHVNTKESERRKGICKLLMEEQMKDFKQRNGKALYLETRFESFPYYIYQGFGFSSINGGGFMSNFIEKDFEEKYFVPSDVVVKPLEWAMFPRMTVLTSILSGEYIRSTTYELYGSSNFEHGFQYLMWDYLEEKLFYDVKIMESKETGAVVGFAYLKKENQWGERTVVLLEYFIHPNFSEHIQKLLRDLAYPQKKEHEEDIKILSYVECDSESKMKVLSQNGYIFEAILVDQIKKNENEEVTKE